MKKSTKTFTGSMAALATVAGIIAPAATVLAAETTAVEVAKDAVTYAEKTVNFFDWNLAFGKVVALGDKEPQYFELLARLSKIEAAVKTPEIKAVLTAMDNLAANKDLTNFYNIMDLSKKVVNVNDMNYLLNELNDWGKTAVFTPEVVAATNAIIKAWTDKTPESIAAAKAAAAKLTAAGNLSWVNAQIAEVEKTMTLSVESVKAVSANSVEVVFNKAVDAETTIDIKLGMVPQDVTVKLSADKKTATLTSEDNFIAGDYTVVVGGIETALKIEAQKIASFTIKTERLTAVASQAVVIEALDQYGKAFDVAPGDFTVSAFNATTGNTVSLGNGDADNKFALGSVAKDDSVLVTITNTATGLSQSKTFKVVVASAVDAIEFKAPSPLKDDARIFVSTVDKEGEKLVLPITLKDQYGDAKVITDALFADGGEVKFISSNNAIVNPNSFEVNEDDELTFETGATAGKVTITAIATKTGKTASITFEVSELATIKSISLQQPTGLIVADEDVTVKYTAKDTLGAAYKLEDLGDVVWFSTNKDVVDEDTDLSLEDGVLTVTPQAAGSVTLSAFIGGAKQGEITLTVKAAAVATKVTKLADSALTYFNVESGTYTYSIDDLVIVDQYNRVMDSEKLTGEVTVEVKDDSTNYVNVTTGSAITASNDKVGTKTATVKYAVDEDTTISKDVTLTVVKAADVVKYELAEVSNTSLYSGSANRVAGHAKTFEIKNGLTADGKKVALSAEDAADFVLTTSDASVAKVEGHVVSAGTVDSDAKTAVVTGWKNGKKISEVTFTTKKAAPAAATIAFNEASYTVDAEDTLDLVTDELKTNKDQYGATLASFPAGTWFSANKEVATVVNGVVTGVAAGETTVTFVSTNGVFVTVTVVVK
jgi:hypothetical protein